MNVRMSVVFASLVAGLAGLAGCSSSSGSSPAQSSGGDGGTGDSGSSTVLAPPPAGRASSSTMQTTIAGSTEDERCKFVQTTEDLWVNSEDIRYTPGSHHFLLWNTPYTSIPTADKNGNTVDTSGVFECPDGGPPAVLGTWTAASAARSRPTRRPSSASCRATWRSTFRPAACSIMDLHVLNARAKRART